MIEGSGVTLLIVRMATRRRLGVMNTEGATNRGRMGKSDESESEESPECDSDYESLSVGSFDTFCEIFLR